MFSVAVFSYVRASVIYTKPHQIHSPFGCLRLPYSASFLPAPAILSKVYEKVHTICRRTQPFTSIRRWADMMLLFLLAWISCCERWRRDEKWYALVVLYGKIVDYVLYKDRLQRWRPRLGAEMNGWCCCEHTKFVRILSAAFCPCEYCSVSFVPLISVHIRFDCNRRYARRQWEGGCHHLRPMLYHHLLDLLNALTFDTTLYLRGSEATRHTMRFHHNSAST